MPYHLYIAMQTHPHTHSPTHMHVDTHDMHAHLWALKKRISMHQSPPTTPRENWVPIAAQMWEWIS